MKLVKLVDYIKSYINPKKNSKAVDVESIEDSDIDIYVEFKHKTFDNLAGLWNHLEELYHKKIDLFHKHKNNNKVIISNIQKDVIYG